DGLMLRESRHEGDRRSTGPLKRAPRHVFMLGNLTSAVNKGKDVAAEFQSSSITSLGEGLRQVSRDAADSLPMTIIRYLNRERTRSQQTRHMLRNVRCHHCPFRPGVEGSEPDGDGAPSLRNRCVAPFE